MFSVPAINSRNAANVARPAPFITCLLGCARIAPNARAARRGPPHPVGMMRHPPGVGNRPCVEWSLVIVALTLLGVAAISGRLYGTPVTPAMVFVLVGLLVGPEVLGEIDLESTSGTVRTLAEATLALVLFCDASRIDIRALRGEVGVALRLLGIGLPLTIALGTLAAAVVLGQLSVEEALILAIVLAPTDAALGQAVVTSRRVPGRVRQELNVESGLN